MHDSDIATVLDADKTQHRIRLGGIDAPERKQAHGQASKKHLADLVAGKAISVEWNKHDKYQRIVGKALLDGQDICLEQVKAGMVWHYKKYESEQVAGDRKKYAEAEDVARTNRLGLWRDKSPVPPWEYLRLRKAGQ